MNIVKAFKRNAAIITATVMMGTVPLAANADVETNTWTDAELYTDSAPLEEKLTRFHSNEVYKDAVNALADKDHNNDFTVRLANSDTKDPARYIIFWDAYLNPDMDVETTVSFGGMSATDAWSSSHNKNMQHVIECRDKILNDNPTTSPLLQFMKVRGCATSKINEIHDEKMSSVFKTVAGLGMGGAAVFFGGGALYRRQKNKPKKMTGHN